MCLSVLPTNMSTYHQHAVLVEARMDLEFQVAVTCYMGDGDQILIPFKCWAIFPALGENTFLRDH